MQTHGYEHSSAWQQSLGLLDKVRAIAAAFENDDIGMADRLRAIAAELPMRAALTFEQLDYNSAKANAASVNDQLFRLRVQLQIAQHLGLVNPRQLKDLFKRINSLDNAINALPDELFEDDGPAAA